MNPSRASRAWAPRAWARRCSGIVAALLLMSGVADPASAAPRDPRLDQVEAQVSALEMQAEAAAEEWNAARGKLAVSQSRVAALRAKAARERASYAAVSKDLGRLIAALYKAGMVDLDVQALFADNPTQFLAQMSAVQQVGASQAVALKRIRARRIALTQAESAVQAEQRIADRLAKQAAAHKASADASLAKASRILAGLKAAERKRLAAIQAAARKAAARRAAKARATVKITLGVVSSRVQRVVRYALSKVGDRYSFGASGPRSFDCSGLMMTSYRQIGISLPHYSRGQYSVTRRVARGSLRPGDLVFFFGRGIKHVGMYIGHNQFVHAANYSTGVVVTSLSDPYYVMRTSGYGRVVR